MIYLFYEKGNLMECMCKEVTMYLSILGGEIQVRLKEC